MGAVKKILGQAWRLQVMLIIHAFHGAEDEQQQELLRIAAGGSRMQAQADQELF
jgi:hypothetical protein